jgi:hypothetical protein
MAHIPAAPPATRGNLAPFNLSGSRVLQKQFPLELVAAAAIEHHNFLEGINVKISRGISAPLFHRVCTRQTCGRYCTSELCPDRAISEG